MNYSEQQRQKAVAMRDELFRDAGGGVYKKQEREFVLNEPILNLWDGVREDAIAYFNAHSIPFWDSGNLPTGHLLSSQIACLNHLYFMRQRQDVATAVLQGVDENVKTALKMEDAPGAGGYVEFEVNGNGKYLGEKSHTRGANSTSVDAVMLAEMIDGSRKLFFIEWKYVEKYGSQSKATDDSGPTRVAIYTPLLQKPDCPLKQVDKVGLFTEPYYQLMRQTLLAHEMVKAKEYGASDYMHLHIIPQENKQLTAINTAAGKLLGTALHDTWANVLKEPEKYKVLDPKDFLAPARSCPDTQAPLNYLEKRYWS